MNVSATAPFPGPTALPKYVILSWKISVRSWLPVAPVVSNDSVIEEVIGVHRVLGDEFVETQLCSMALRLSQFKR